MPLLDVQDLTIEYLSPVGWITAIDRVNFSINEGEFRGVAGESGCGKSTLALGLAGLLPRSAKLKSGSVKFNGEELINKSERDWRRLRGPKIAFVLQSGMSALNPVLKIEAQFRDMMQAHKVRDVDPGHMLELVGVPRNRLASYAHQLSGGMRQRVVIALALCMDPSLIIMDEPTTALDVVVQHEIFERLQEIQTQRSFAIMLVTHDLGLLLERAQRVSIMYAGRIVEEQAVSTMLQHPRHPYTQGLLRAFPRLGVERGKIESIPGHPPSLLQLPTGCTFHPRCPNATDFCRDSVPEVRVVNGAQVACHYSEEWKR